VVEVRGTLDELYELFAEAAKKEARSTAKKAGKRAVKKVVKETPRKLSAWQKYIKRKANHIKFKSGPKKGMLNLKAMSKKFKRGRK
jgi:hypothetical protein